MHPLSSRWRYLAAALALATLAGCNLSPPQMTVTQNDLALAQIVTITSKDAKPFFIQKVVANHNDGNTACVNTSGQNVAPGQDDTVTFVGCGQIKYVAIYTDRGFVEYQFGGTSQ